MFFTRSETNPPILQSARKFTGQYFLWALSVIEKARH